LKKTQQHISSYNKAYFIGIGGIGMSAIARYFNNMGWKVAGYDKTETVLTKKLVAEGIAVHYEDLGPSIPEEFQKDNKTLFIYTPAIPRTLGELCHIQSQNLPLLKRAEVLGMITRNSIALGVAGTHGKTTTSTLLAHILDTSPLKCNAFLGGIATNFNSNFVESKESEFTVIEADEFDRSFLQLTPFASIITSTDADHLDIYGDAKEMVESFQQYAELTNDDGFLIRQINTEIDAPEAITYGINCSADYVGENLKVENGSFFFDLNTPNGKWNKIELGIPGIHNTENAIACIAMCIELEIDEKTIRLALKTFLGVKRRFEYHIRTEDTIYIDDYAHHPTELNALISSVQLMYPGKTITGIFQPHLFTRTRDFFTDFALQLSRLDEVILLPIYPAREEPIQGVTSEALMAEITQKNKQVLSPSEAIEYCNGKKSDIYLSIGAGDIDRIIEPLKSVLQ